MGALHRATDARTGRVVAVKTLALGDAPEVVVKRFQREAAALRELSHPNVVELLDHGLVHGFGYIVMELLVGTTLDELLAEYALPPADALRIVRDVLRALGHAHERGIVHRDIKPSNIFLVGGDPRGTVKVLDFGLVKMPVDHDSGEVTLTRAGTMIGSLPYMSPEQVIGRGADARSDVYSVGILLHELLTERHPFAYARRSQIAAAHLAEPIQPLTDVRPTLRVGAGLQELVDRATMKAPDERYASAGEMLAALTALPPNAARIA